MYYLSCDCCAKTMITCKNFWFAYSTLNVSCTACKLNMFYSLEQGWLKLWASSWDHEDSWDNETETRGVKLLFFNTFWTTQSFTLHSAELTHFFNFIANVMIFVKCSKKKRSKFPICISLEFLTDNCVRCTKKKNYCKHWYYITWLVISVIIFFSSLILSLMRNCRLSFY